MSAISEDNNFLSRKAGIMTKRSVVKTKIRKPVPFKWVFKIREDHDGLFFQKSRNLVKGYMQVPGIDFTESLSPIASYTSKMILIVLTW